MKLALGAKVSRAYRCLPADSESTEDAVAPVRFGETPRSQSLAIYGTRSLMVTSTIFRRPFGLCIAKAKIRTRPRPGRIVEHWDVFVAGSGRQSSRFYVA